MKLLRLRRPVKIRILATVLSIFVVVCFLEITVSFFGPFKRAGKTPDNVLWEPDSKIGFVPAKNLDLLFYSAEWINRIQTNDFGMRTESAAAIPKRPGHDSILFLGDSQTMAIQVPADSTYVALIDKELVRRRSRWRAVNAGCNGFNTIQEYMFFQKLYDEGFRPKVVVVYATNNDLYEDVPGLAYGRYKIENSGYLTLLVPSRDSLEQLRRAKEAPPHEGNVALRYSALLRHLWYAYRIYRNPHDVLGWVQSSYLHDDVDPAAKSRWNAAAAALRTLNRLVSSYGGSLVIAVHPDPVEWSDAYYSKLMKLVPEISREIDRMKLQHGYRRVAEDIGVTFIDMLKDFPAVSVSDFRFAMDPHANASGHRIIARQLLNGFSQVGVAQ